MSTRTAGFVWGLLLGMLLHYFWMRSRGASSQ